MGKKAKLSMIQYTNTVIKARFKWNALKQQIKGSDGDWEVVYNIKRGSPITLKHILSVLFYTNHTDLSSEFSQSFRKLYETETDQSLKERHSEYRNWGKYLRETIEC
eukprot:829968_1